MKNVVKNVQGNREIAKIVEQVWFIDGHHPNRIVDILNSGDTIGTRICSEPE